MIPVTRLDGSVIVINADLVETVEHHGDTVVTLVSGTRFVVREGVDEMVSNIMKFRAGVLRLAEAPAAGHGGAAAADNVIPLDAAKRPADGK